MGIRHYGNYADTVTEEFVTETCPTAMDELNFVIDDNDYTMSQLAYCANSGDIQGELEMELDEDKALLILNAYEKVATIFKAKIGLDLDLGFTDDGDSQGDLYWAVSGVYVLSPAGKKHEDKITRKFWVDTD